jgi:MOSC domain-containing protein YiiM
MKLLSVNCGLPREVPWHGIHVTTSIYKEPVSGRIALRTLNLDGDRQSDLSVHGGKYKAVYCYPVEHYQYWGKQLPGRELSWGAFGENFTTEGLVEQSTYIGDRFSIGSSEVVVTQPRLPCFKLGIRFQSDDMIKRFLASGRTGFYLAVTREGEVGAQDEIAPLSHDPDGVSVSDFTRLYLAKQYDVEDVRQLRRALALDALPNSWKDYLGEKMNRLLPSTAEGFRSNADTGGPLP